MGVFLVALGHGAANIAFGLAVSIHAMGVTLLLEPWLAPSRFRVRLLWSLAILAALGWLLYLPCRNYIDTHWFTPLRVNGQVVIVGKRSGPGNLQRGDWIAYSLQEVGYARAGLGLGPVLALAGDEVRFTPTALRINGVPQPRLPHMPDSGVVVVPEKHWFVWPEFDISGHGYLGEPAAISQAILQSAMISEAHFVGKPFKRWFWHRQFPS
jgi:hypothetical protein